MNRSLYSQTVEAELPDVIPPMPPSIKEIHSDKLGIKIEWDPSPSDDVVSYSLERRASDSLEWKLRKLFSVKDSTAFRDENAEKNKRYHYRLFSIDRSGLKSTPSNQVSGKFLFAGPPATVKNFMVEADRERKVITLRWKYNLTGVVKYMIYRAVGDEPITLYKAIPADRFLFEDNEVRMNTFYRYRIKSVFKEGRESGFSEEKQIQF
jgi:fibronectin type 3 domain-containing protein